MEHANIILAGFGIVMGVLAMLWGITVLIAKAFAETPKPKQQAIKPAATSPAPASAPAVTSNGLPAHHLAVISAAVAASFDTPHRIVSVGGLYAHVSAWTQQGLFEHFASHRKMWQANTRTMPGIKS